MLTQERKQLILERLSTRGRVVAADLAMEFDVSIDTVRRDLRELDGAGLLRRVHGGALPRQGDAAPFAARAQRAPEAKASIARRAAELVQDGQLVIIDGGTTTLELARALRSSLRARVITNSPPIAIALAEHPLLDITLVGGTLRHNALTSVGAAAVATFDTIRADIVFLGVCGLHPEIGVTTEDVEERHVKAAMIHGAGEVVALADHDKLGTVMPVVIAPLSAVTQLVTDAEPHGADLVPYRDAGISVVAT
jgi:DeoR/GlpR family transcriptional regulator of sugar metabolism